MACHGTLPVRSLGAWAVGSGWSPDLSKIFRWTYHSLEVIQTSYRLLFLLLYLFPFNCFMISNNMFKNYCTCPRHPPPKKNRHIYIAVKTSNMFFTASCSVCLLNLQAFLTRRGGYQLGAFTYASVKCRWEWSDGRGGPMDVVRSYFFYGKKQVGKYTNPTPLKFPLQNG